MKGRPLVSVLMTAYNREKFISEAIESVIGSTYNNWELIVTDDCSTDTTLEIAQKYEGLDSRIRVFKNEVNLGDYPNRNKAANYVTGEIIMSVDSDDLLFPESMAKCISLFNQYPNASFGIFCPNSKWAEVLTPEQIIQRHFFSSPTLLIGPGGTIIKSSYFKQIGGFPTKYGPANDGYYNLKAASQTNSILIPFELSYYRRHDGQEINNKYGYLTNSYRYLKDALKELELPISPKEKKYLLKKNKRRFLTNIFKFYFKTRDLKKAKVAWKAADFSFKDSLVAIFQ